MVVLNTNLYYDQNNETAGEEDPAGQFQWLEETLTNASRADEMVLKEISKLCRGLLPAWKLILLRLSPLCSHSQPVGHVGFAFSAALAFVGVHRGARPSWLLREEARQGLVPAWL